MGKYIVCGEAHKEGHVVQANCFETVIDRLDNNSEIEFCENIIWQRYFYQNDDYAEEKEKEEKEKYADDQISKCFIFYWQCHALVLPGGVVGVICVAIISIFLVSIKVFANVIIPLPISNNRWLCMPSTTEWPGSQGGTKRRGEWIKYF